MFNRFKKTSISIALAAVMASSLMLPSAMPVFAENPDTVTEAEETVELTEEEETEITETPEEETVEAPAEETAENEEAEEPAAEESEEAETTEETTVETEEETMTVGIEAVTTISEDVPAREVVAQGRKNDVVTTSTMVDAAIDDVVTAEKKEPVLYIDEKKTMYGDTTSALSMYLENAQVKDVRWKSSNTDIAVVSSDGTITAKASGDCKITAWVKGTSVKAVCRLKVIRYKVMTVNATAYCACAKCCGKSDGITATGTHATQGRTIAVDPRMIPLGSKVEINGHIYVAEDVGGGVKNNRIDIFFNSHYEALVFGRRTMTIKVYY